ncbi:MAG: hypothetical protein ACLQI7_12270, partial [Streptosporangiaceae bacterium]
MTAGTQITHGPSATAAPSTGTQLAAGRAHDRGVSAKVGPSWQTNNTVWALAVANGVVYVGGSFTSVRPPGDQPGTGEVARNYLAAFSARSGALQSFDPSLNGRVTALAVSPRGNVLYAGGSFTRVDRQPRPYLAAFSTATGQLSTTWTPTASGSVLSIATAPSGAPIYVGGNFTKLDGQARTRAGALSRFGKLQSWAPSLNGSVTSVAVAPNDSRVLVGGYFSTLDGARSQAIGSTDPVTGARKPWHSIEPNHPGCSAAVKDIIIGGATRAHPAGIAYVASEGTGGGCFDGDWAAYVRTGALIWQNDCLGATQSLAIVDGRLYKGSHAHDCAYAPGGFPQVNNPAGGWITHHLLSQSLTDGTLGHWTPNTTSLNGGLGPRVMATDGSQLFVGGDFSEVNGQPQQGFVRFPAGPDTASPGRPAAPTAISHSKGATTVTFSAVSDPDVGRLHYAIYRDGGARPIATLNATSWPWALPVLHYRDTGLRVGSRHTYTVTVSNGTSTSAASPASGSVIVSGKNPPRSYPHAVVFSHPSFFWRLNQTSGRIAKDASPHGFTGIYEKGTREGAAGPITGRNGSATKFNGRQGLVTAARRVSGPQIFSTVTSRAAGRVGPSSAAGVPA